VEIFSEHGNSLEPTSAHGMYSHSMGGMDRGQSGLLQLQAGRRFGLLASGDDHFGYPGSYGQGLTAVIADELSRPAILQAFRSRRTYAATGDRIDIEFHVNGGLPGDVVEVSDGASIRASVGARDRIRLIDILKNGRHWKRFGPESYQADASEDEQLLRIEWGWDLLSSEIVTTWELDVRVADSRITGVTPSFCGGAGSVTELNLIDVPDDHSLHASTYTSRKNTRPVNSLSFTWIGGSSALLEVEVRGRNGERPFHRRLDITKNELRTRDHYLSAFDVFSSP